MNRVARGLVVFVVFLSVLFWLGMFGQKFEMSAIISNIGASVGIGIAAFTAKDVDTWKKALPIICAMLITFGAQILSQAFA
ncbi:hypothetical protein BA953_16630 [Vibrio coralliilyticus]|nr:hypothetical protein BA953_16630 [Vibrio coralliilyticus]